MVYLPTTSAANDFYGGQRPGPNRYANSVVALKAATGEVIWHYQITHHDIWDTDLPAGTTIELTVLARRGEVLEPIQGLSGLTEPSADLAGRVPRGVRAIVLQARLSTTDVSETPRLQSWGVTWE